LGFDSFLVSQHSNPSLVDTTVMPMKYSADTTLVLGSYVSLDHVVSHQPMIEEVVMSMKSSIDSTLLSESDKSKEVTSLMHSSVNPTLLLWGDASFDHVLIISSSLPSAQGSIHLSLSTLPPSSSMVSFDWNLMIL
jgi:hypothetical protein